MGSNSGASLESSLHFGSIRNPPNIDPGGELASMTSLPPPPHGAGPRGFPLGVLTVQNDKYICGLCSLLLREPVQSECGHRFCKYCLAWVTPGTMCPRCELEDEEAVLQVTQYFPDPAIRKEMYKQQAACDSQNCKWTGQLKEYLVHIDACERKLVSCQCGVTVAKIKLSQHQATECSLRQINCTYCTRDVIARDIGQHLNVCTDYPLECPNKCDKKVKRDQIEEHTATTGDCPNKPCPFGCPERSSEHAQNAAPAHCLLLLQMILSLQAQCKTHNETEANAVRTVMEKMKVFENKVQEVEKKVTQSLSDSPRTSSFSRNAHLPSDVAIAGPTHYRVQQRSTPSTYNIEEITEKQSTLESLVAVLNREVEKLIKDQRNIEHQRNIEKETVHLLTNKVASLERSHAVVDVTLAEHDLRMKELETTTYDGTLVWPITDFRRRRQAAISGRSLSIYSSPFYTSRAGYKMCARIYLNGDGMGKGTHISLFFVIMKGQYDGVLTWPFRQKVTMMLLDQNNREHMVDAFRPDPSSSSFKRPQSDMNIASGVPIFCPLARLEDSRCAYVKDDTMFLKIMVDLNGLKAPWAGDLHVVGTG